MSSYMNMYLVICLQNASDMYSIAVGLYLNIYLILISRLIHKNCQRFKTYSFIIKKKPLMCLRINGVLRF